MRLISVIVVLVVSCTRWKCPDLQDEACDKSILYCDDCGKVWICDSYGGKTQKIWSNTDLDCECVSDTGGQIRDSGACREIY